VKNETADRIATGLITVIPIIGVGLVAWQSAKGGLHFYDLIAFAVIYLLTGLGVTVGFHRYFTHRSFSTTRPIRALLAILGSAAIEGPIISWVADHRKHHVFSDREGDPHSPHHGFEGKRFPHLRGLAHAHLGWLFLHTDRAAKERYAPDLLKDPMIRFIDRTFLLWAVAGLVAPFALGVALGGTVWAGLTGLLWGGAIRMFLLHHVTSLLRAPALRDRRRVAEPGLARAVLARRGLAQQPPCVPHVGDARAAAAGADARPVGPVHLGAREAGPGLERRARGA
jgi:stearoyl-CoA desaturase (Delta-9 desaturase)